MIAMMTTTASPMRRTMNAWRSAAGGRRPPPVGRRRRGAARGAVRVSSGSSKNDTLLAPCGNLEAVSMNTGTAVRRFRTFARKGEGGRRREKMPVHTGDPSESQAPTRVGGARGRGEASSRVAREGESAPRVASGGGGSPRVASQDERIGGPPRARDGRIVLDRYRLRRRRGTG